MNAIDEKRHEDLLALHLGRSLELLDEVLKDSGYSLTKDEKRRLEASRAVSTNHQNGTLDALIERWENEDYPRTAG